MVFRNICCSISPTIDSLDFRIKSHENSPNLFNVCQALIAKKKLLILFAQKSWAKMLVKSTHTPSPALS